MPKKVFDISHLQANINEYIKSMNDLITTAIDAAISKGWLSHGDLAVITAGVPLGISGNTNLIKVETV